ncbi:MAG: hypothetical protein O9311_18900 [Cytophagales bacterium]|nr:hypothetical protein [Cytophagales bacterium]
MKALRFVWLALFVCVTHHLAWSQAKPDVELVKVDTAIQKINNSKGAAETRADTLQKKIANRFDSLKGLQTRTDRKLDSLQQVGRQPASKLDSAQRALADKWEKRQKRLQQQIDSLREKKLPTAKLEARAQKFGQSLDSLRQKIRLPNAERLTGKVNELQSKVIDKANAASTSATETLAGKQRDINQAIGKINGLDKSLSIPAVQQVAIPNMGNTGSLAVPGNNPLQGINTTPPAGTNAAIPNLPGSTLSAPGVATPAVPGATLPSTPNLGTNVQSPTGQLNQAQGQLKAYTGEMQKVREGRIDSSRLQKLAEQHVDSKELKKLREQEAAISKYQQMSERYRDPEAMKKELEQKSKAIANEKLDENKAKVEAAVGDLQKAKNKYGNINSLDSLPRRRFNPWRGKSFAERLVPAIGMQVQTTKNFWLDLTPHVGYRFNERVVAGLGWNERVAMNFDRGNYYIASERVFGPRAHLQYRWHKVTFRADVECLNTFLKEPGRPLDQLGRGWVWSCFVGIKQNFKITKRLNGYAQVSYNVYNPINQSPYNDRLALRFGFEWPLVKGLGR